MRVRKTLAWIVFSIAGLAVGAARFAVLAALLCAVACLLLIVGAQLYGWGWLGHSWHPVPVAELLDDLRIGIPSTSSDWLGQLYRLALVLPASGTLVVAALLLFWINRLLSRLDQHRRRALLGSRQTHLLSDIEAALKGH